jgi:hypothetical protein
MSFQNYLNEIFDDMRDCAEQISADRNAFLRQFPLLPPTVSIGKGRRIYVSQKSVFAIQEISRVYRENSTEYRRAFSNDDMANLFSSAIGSVIGASTAAGATEFPIPTDPEAFWTELRVQLASDIAQLSGKRTHLFGAWVIQGAAIPFIAVGPCRFSLRGQWLQEAVAEGLLNKSQASRLRDYWNYGSPIDQDPAHGLDGWIIKEIAEAVGQCPWVCEIQLSGHTDARSRQRALLAVRIALSAISLAWQTPSQQAERKGTGLIYVIGPEHSRDTVTFRNGSLAVVSHESVLRLGRFLTMDDAPAGLWIFPDVAAVRFRKSGLGRKNPAPEGTRLGACNALGMGG